MKRVLVLICILSVLLSFPALALEDGTDSAADSLSETDLVDSPVESDSSDSVAVSADTSDSESGVTVNVTIQQPETSPIANALEDVSETPSAQSVSSETSDVDAAASSDPVPVYSLYDLSPTASGSASSEVSYSLTPTNCDPEYIQWFFDNGSFTVLLTDAWFDAFGVTRDAALAGMSQYPHSFTVNDSPLEDYSLDASVGSVTFPYVEDGAYVLHSDAGLSLVMQVTSTTISGSPSGSSLVSAIKALFGSYTPKTYNVTTYLSDGTAIQSTEIVPGLAGLDYEWIAGAALFALLLYGLLRMIGGLLKR